MKLNILAAGFLAATALTVTGANALTINLGTDLGVDLTLSDDLDVNVDAGVDAGATTNNNGNNTNVGAGAAAGAGVATGNEGAGAAVGAAAEGQVMLRTEGDDTTMVAVDAAVLAGLAVFTNDGEEVGTVTGVQTDAEGNAMVVVDLDDDWYTGMNTIAINAALLAQVDGGLDLDTDEAELRALIDAHVAAAATTTTR